MELYIAHLLFFRACVPVKSFYSISPCSRQRNLAETNGTVLHDSCSSKSVCPVLFYIIADEIVPVDSEIVGQRCNKRYDRTALLPRVVAIPRGRCSLFVRLDIDQKYVLRILPSSIESSPSPTRYSYRTPHYKLW